MMALSNRARAAARRLIAVSTAFAAVVGVAAWAVIAAGPVLAAPEPSPIPKRWQLDITTSPLQTAVISTPGSSPRAYFFMTYRVTNNSPQDLLFAPSFELATDEGDLLRSGRDVPLDVTREILGRLDNPLVEDQISIVGTLLRGPENAKQGLVIWPITQDHLNEVAVYCAGFSGETATVAIPGADGRPLNKLLRKSWMMRYRMPGDMKPGGGDLFQPNESRWIMR
jgi:hypothetical protein